MVENIISISDFNIELNDKAFDDTKANEEKEVMENARLMDEVSDARLLAIAIERMSRNDFSTLTDFVDVNQELGIVTKDLEGFDEIEFE